MNANELADELKYFHETLCDTGAINAVISGLKVKQIETMLRQQQAEIEALKWAVNHREQDVDALKTKLNDVKYKYDIKIHQHVYTQVYVDELQAEIEALKAKLAQIAAEDKKLFEAVQKANDIWDRATGRKP